MVHNIVYKSGRSTTGPCTEPFECSPPLTHYLRSILIGVKEIYFTSLYTAWEMQVYDCSRYPMAQWRKRTCHQDGGTCEKLHAQ